ncbi:nitrate reductase subunit alpha [Mesosutterella sp. AGMB02718]|uniref:nitrate reductase (quinone) n=1 Tax=Mesosutterella faecium TaxID=2925194 RepID=A0ABT7IMR1_9BURK|nr:nitrate reductase subunit alpha [Mesosutterella sp. AGMB02718]MDL2059659.1 nitrate reductase subunit alpha [Mesosutterella sp. AGMB02718]
MTEPFSSYRYFSRKDTDNRAWEKFYRSRWQHDKVVRSTHGVNCTGSCSWRIFVKKGIVTWELQETDYPRTADGIPNHEPRGCPRGASYSWYLYSSGRVKHPMIRRELLELWEQAKREKKDPVEAWGAIVSDPARKLAYKKVRGLGGFVRLDWDSAIEIMAAANIWTTKVYGPDRNAGFTPIPAFSQVSYAAGIRYLSLIGGTSLSFYDWYCDLPPSSPQTWGEQTDVPESADWYNSAFLMLWGSNVPVTRTPDSPFLTQVRYKGTQVVVISPDYSDASKFADVWLAPKQGTDSALGMAMGHVVLKEFFVDRRVPYFEDYVKKFTDLPFMVKLEKREDGFVPGRFLRASDFEGDLGIDSRADFYPVLTDEKTGDWVVPNGTIGSRWSAQGRWNLKNEDFRTGRPFTPQLSRKGSEDARLTVLFPYFGGETFSNPNFAFTAHSDIQKRIVPAKRIIGKDGREIWAANVFDLMLAQYGVDNGLGDPGAARSYEDDIPYTPKWQEAITGVPAERVIRVARQFAETAEKTRGRAMIIIGAGVNQWYNTDMTYRAAINLLMLCGTCGVNGGGWSHYVGQEKVRAAAGWAQLTFGLDWIRPARQMNTTSFIYMHSDQWRYEKVQVADQLSPLADNRKDWSRMTLVDCNIRSQRMGWLPAEPELSRNPLQLAREADAAGKPAAKYIAEELGAGRLQLASEDIDAEGNSPKTLFIWRANLIGCSAKGMEYFMKHLLGSENAVLGQNIEECGLPLPEFTKWHSRDVTGKLDLVTTIDFRMTTSALYSDIVLPAATWYEKEDMSSTDMHCFLHPFSKAVEPAWEARSDWDVFKALARRFSELCAGHLGVEKDVVMTPLQHDTPQETAAPMAEDDWRVTGSEPVPGVTMGSLVTVVRDYPHTYERFTSVGPNLRDKGIGAKGFSWDSRPEYELLKGLNGVVEEGPAKGAPKLEDAVDGVNMILTLDPTSNGRAGRRSWKALEKCVGLKFADRLCEESGDTRYTYHELQVQPRRALNTPIWTGVNSGGMTYTANWTNVNCLIPWRTLTGRQSFYVDHPWLLAFGEALAGYKPPLCKKEINSLKERLGIKEPTLALNLLTPHNKWTTHSTWSDNLIMLTLGRGGPVIWMSEKDAEKLGISDNDWVEALNDNGSTVARACVSQRIPQGALFMYHNQGRTVNVPLSPTTGRRAGVHNSISRVCPKPTHMAGGYAQFSFGLNYYGTIGANRDEFVLLRRLDHVEW